MFKDLFKKIPIYVEYITLKKEYEDRKELHEKCYNYVSTIIEKTREITYNDNIITSKILKMKIDEEIYNRFEIPELRFYKILKEDENIISIEFNNKEMNKKATYEIAYYWYYEMNKLADIVYQLNGCKRYIKHETEMYGYHFK